MTAPGRNSSAASLWLLMLALDADGKRKNVEFDEIQGCLEELQPCVSDNAGSDPAVLTAYLDEYYKVFESDGVEAVLGQALQQIDDPDLRQQLFVMLMRVAISDKQLHKQENTLLRRIGLAWGLSFKDA